MAYDSIRGRIVLFGGLSLTTEFGDTWEYGNAELCNGEDDNADAVIPTIETDIDGDGYVACSPWVGSNAAILGGRDCDELDPSIRPGAVESCNGIDDNCDDRIDEAFDQDSDGVTVCSGDCDDIDATTYPGAPQTCDGRNNDCLDSSWPTVPANESDTDSDSYRLCNSDCDDTNPAAHPGAIEICNAIDDNCNGIVDKDAAGVDSDGDGVHNACDNCRFAFNPTQQDSDHDGLGNACDNCITTPNPNQADLDADQRGDACDNCPSSYNPLQDDSDSDQAGDVCDNCILDPNRDQSDLDSDFEGDVCDLNDDFILLTITDDYVTWQQEEGFFSFNQYRGDLAGLRQAGLYTQDPATYPLAVHNCNLFDAFALDDGANPSVGQAVFYLVTAVSGGIESTLGTNSAGFPRLNSNPCP